MPQIAGSTYDVLKSAFLDKQHAVTQVVLSLPKGEERRGVRDELTCRVGGTGFCMHGAPMAVQYSPWPYDKACGEALFEISVTRTSLEDVGEVMCSHFQGRLMQLLATVQGPKWVCTYVSSRSYQPFWGFLFHWILSFAKQHLFFPNYSIHCVGAKAVCWLSARSEPNKVCVCLLRVPVIIVICSFYSWALILS